MLRLAGISEEKAHPAGVELIMQIPDDLSRWALEALLAEGYRQGKITKPDLRRLLGFETGDRSDSFLKDHSVWIDYTAEDLERERAGLARLGF